MRTKIIVIIGVATLLPLTAFAAVAANPTQQAAQQAQQTAHQAQVQAACTAQNTRITARITDANSHIAKREQLDQNAQAHWQKLISRAEAAPYSIAATDATITSLQADIAAFQSQLTTNIADHQTYADDLQAVLNAPCGHRLSQRTQAQTDFKTWESVWGAPHAIRVQKVRQDVLALLQKMVSVKKTSKGGAN